MNGILKPPPLRNPVLSFGLVYVLLLIIYALYAWGITELMERVIMKDRSCDRNNLISLFVIFSGGMVLFLSNKSDVDREHAKVDALLDTVGAYSAAVSVISSSASDFNENSGAIQVGQHFYTHREALHEASMYVLTSLLVFYTEQIMPIDATHVSIITSNSNNMSYKTQLALDFEEIKSDFGMNACMIMQNRCLQMAEKKIFRTRTALDACMSNVRAKTESLIVLTKTSTYWWINFVVRLFGILYMLATPFLLWITQGYMTILWAVVVFVCFGSVIFYRYYIGDALRNPTRWGVGVAIGEMMTLAKKTDDFITRLPREKSGGPLTKFTSIYTIVIGAS